VVPVVADPPEEPPEELPEELPALALKELDTDKETEVLPVVVLKPEVENVVRLIR
jgi:hypothetical protein